MQQQQKIRSFWIQFADWDSFFLFWNIGDNKYQKKLSFLV
mgnify:CR=1 FL=1